VDLLVALAGGGSGPTSGGLPVQCPALLRLSDSSSGRSLEINSSTTERNCSSISDNVGCFVTLPGSGIRKPNLPSFRKSSISFSAKGLPLVDPASRSSPEKTGRAGKPIGRARRSGRVVQAGLPGFGAKKLTGTSGTGLRQVQGRGRAPEPPLQWQSPLILPSPSCYDQQVR